MWIIGLLISSIATLIQLIVNILVFILVVRVILSWFQVNPYHELVEVIYRVTDPLLFPFRKLPLRYKGLDFTPVLAFICLYVLNDFLVNLLRVFAAKFH
ncbi:MAG: YggT family protein [Candidatus Omnitrophica bacterium]|nr:YggT family protein [Candidatus Omnitrophota bacterium]